MHRGRDASELVVGRGALGRLRAPGHWILALSVAWLSTPAAAQTPPAAQAPAAPATSSPLPAAPAEPTPPPSPSAPTLGAPALAAMSVEPPLGGAGESCRARSDCRPGLRCLGQVCVDPREGTTCGASRDCGGELLCIDRVCRSAVASHREAAGEAGDEAADEWSSFSLDGVHAFVGIGGRAGPMYGLIDGRDATVAADRALATGLFALRGGLIIDEHELAIEVSPMTFAWIEGAAGPAFQMNATYGRLLPLHRSESLNVYWPLRVGAGLFTGNTSDSVFFQARADVVGLLFQIGHVTIDVHAPSFRYAMWPSPRNDAAAHLMYWDFGAGVSYVF